MKLPSIVFIALLIAACGGGSGDGPDPTPQPESIPTPLAVNLIFPENNSECNEGAVTNENDTQSLVTFRWTSSENTDSYEVNLRNINTNNTSKTSSLNTELAIKIDRGIPYEWHVVSKANLTNETAKSTNFKFYNQGSGIENYAPFPAEVFSPARGATIQNSGNVTLKWNSSDVDNDIVEYNVLFGTQKPPNSSIGITTTKELSVTINSGLIYYWQVITKDSQNNTSTSEIFEFKVD